MLLSVLGISKVGIQPVKLIRLLLLFLLRLACAVTTISRLCGLISVDVRSVVLVAN